ncbi:RsiV family protein [Acinetobacter sp.]|uniref:RsiV family protein n=1 Tax=Acinetobacter sp. TaxID=472 RepID=UPI0031DEB1E8
MNLQSKITTAVLMALGLTLSACQKQQQETPAASQPAEASAPVAPKKASFSADIQPVNVQLPKCEGNSCPEFQVQRLKSNVEAINKQIDQAILTILKENLDLSDQPASELSSSQPMATTQNSDEFTQAVTAYANHFMQLDQQLKKMGANPQISLHIQPKVLPSPNGVVTIQLNSDNFLGGAHGTASQQYFVFDAVHNKHLKLDDVLLKQQRPALEKLAYQQFQQWVMTQKLADSVKNYEQAWPFKLTNNFYFDDKGLNLQYGEYEIGPYVVGMPTFTLSYAQLNGIVKPQYLPKSAQ